MKLNWWNDYVGIPYVAGGRSRDGVDCWGLVRLVYADQLGIQLPSFEQVAPGEEAAEVMARNREEWTPVADIAKPGDVALFRVLGSESHVGVITQAGHFLHAREGQDSVIERYDAGVWQKRLVGRFRYSGETKLVTLTGSPHPLKTERIEAVAPEGASLGHMIRVNCMLADLPPEVAATGFAYLDDQLIPFEEWDSVFPKSGQSVVYRVLPRGGKNNPIIRVILMLAVVVASIFLPPLLGFAAGTFGAAAAGLAISVGGSLLVNAIAPIRPPKQTGAEALSPVKDRYNLSGGSNNETPYGAIPVVLGRHRFTPPVGAHTYIEQAGKSSNMRMALVWGYGPLDISDLRVGETPLSNYDNLIYETVTGRPTDNLGRFSQIYGTVTNQTSVNQRLLASEDYIYRTTADDADHVCVQLFFPNGLWGSEAVSPNYVGHRQVDVSIQIRQVGVATWGEVNQTVFQKSFNLTPARTYIENSFAYNNTPDPEDWWLTTYGGPKYRVGSQTVIPLYKWYLVTLDKFNNIIIREGTLTDSKENNPSPQLLNVLQAENYGMTITPNYLPSPGTDEEQLYAICVYDDSILQVYDRRLFTGGGAVSGCDITYSGLYVTIGAGTISRSETNTVQIVMASRDPFDYAARFFVPRGQYEVRVRRTNDNSGLEYPSYDDVYFTTLTSYTNQFPINMPKPLAMTALQIEATSQVNGRLEGITGTVCSICKDYRRSTNSWITQYTSNPASLFRYVLQHPAFAQPVADSAIDIATLERWHTFCEYQGFSFNSIVVNQTPVYELLADIAAAGRASPTIRDGKWSVVIDEPKTAIAQHFTPHNSFDFSATKALPKMPHGFRVRFNNRDKGYQLDERIVYADGYNASNATLIEGIEFPGVTNAEAIHAHARFHLAQLLLRPEEYVINTDLEHLVCTRGDLVRVTHDVPMWGLGSGRISSVTNTTTLVLDEPVPMDAGVQYTIRIRRETGETITRTVSAKITDGYYTTINLAAGNGIATGLVNPGDLFLFGSLSQESVECLVKTIEPTGPNTARLTLVDYAPAIFNADDEEIPAFNSQITLPPILQRDKVTELPTIQSVISDESALVRTANGQYVTTIKVGFSNPIPINRDIQYVEAQVATTDQSPRQWKYAGRAPVTSGAIYIQPVQEGTYYDVRIRYLRNDLNAGPWRTVAANYRVIGKSTPPQAVTNFTNQFDGNTGAILKWTANKDIDLLGYEIRVGTNWNTATVLVKNLQATTFKIPTIVGASTTYLIKALDTAGNYSTSATSTTVTITLPSAVGLTFSISGENAILKWGVTKGTIATDYYIVKYGNNYNTATTVATTKTTNFRTKVEWGGTRRYWIATVDLAGNVGELDFVDIVITKPSAVTITQEVIDNNVILRWSDATQTLPISTYEVRKGSTFATSTLVGRVSSRVLSFFETTAGSYRYWVVGIDSSGTTGTAASIVARVSNPPDYKLKLNYDSTLTGTTSNLKG